MVLNGANKCVKAMYKALCGSAYIFYGNHIHSYNKLKINSIVISGLRNHFSYLTCNLNSKRNANKILNNCRHVF